jgi:hypothetical protein
MAHMAILRIPPENYKDDHIHSRLNYDSKADSMGRLKEARALLNKGLGIYQLVSLASHGIQSLLFHTTHHPGEIFPALWLVKLWYF